MSKSTMILIFGGVALVVLYLVLKGQSASGGASATTATAPAAITPNAYVDQSGVLGTQAQVENSNLQASQAQTNTFGSALENTIFHPIDTLYTILGGSPAQ